MMVRKPDGRRRLGIYWGRWKVKGKVVPVLN
jgi:hypothetical protein